MGLIETVGLGRRFDGTVAVEDLTLQVREGEVFGFLGPNGAGKTTTVRMLCYLIRATAGTAYVAGNEIGREPDATNIRSMVGLLPEAPGLYDALTAEESLDFFARLHGVGSRDRRRRIEELLRWLGLWDRRDARVATFSRGMKQKVALARALLHEPPLLFLDEPTAALDPSAAKAVRELLGDLRREGRTVFLNTHNLDEAQRVCDRIGVVNTRLLALGTPQELAARYWRPATTVRLREVTPAVREAVEALDFVESLEVRGEELLVDLDDPRERNPALVRAILDAGGKIEFLVEKERGLEDVYLRLVGTP